MGPLRSARGGFLEIPDMGGTSIHFFLLPPPLPPVLDPDDLFLHHDRALLDGGALVLGELPGPAPSRLP